MTLYKLSKNVVMGKLLRGSITLSFGGLGNSFSFYEILEKIEKLMDESYAFDDQKGVEVSI